VETLKNVIEIYQGESFVIDKIIRNEDGTPYIIPKIDNPYFVLSIDSASYLSTGDKYSVRYWLPISKTFYDSKPIRLSDLRKSENSESLKNYSEITEFPCTLYYIDGYYKFTSPDVAVFTDGSSYKYANVKEDGALEWLDYSCRLSKLFTCEDTLNWKASLYTYSILLVGGERNCNSSNGEPIKINYSVPILKPTELKVLNYSQGGVR
jgi:hypothetical protein